MNKADKNFDWFADNLSSHKFDIISCKRRRQTHIHTHNHVKDKLWDIIFNKHKKNKDTRIKEEQATPSP